MQVPRFLFLCGVLGLINYGFGCQLSEFMCDTGYCVALDKFCNGNDDCGDKSDEPPYCSPCNRTYHGEVGRTYELEVRRPREDRLPFLCYLNFTAAGGKYGDIIQLTFDTFTVGRFVSYTSDGCPDGYMSIRESQLPDTGGQWCGSAWGFTVYYSETRSINLTLTLSKLSEQGIGYNFDFKLSYKYLKKSDAHLRYGNSTFQTWRGQMITGSYCDRILDQCDRKLCRVQSPNFPGAYPRNVTCYYRIEQRTAPKSKRALIVVRQPNAHKIHIKDQVINYDRSQRTLSGDNGADRPLALTDPNVFRYRAFGYVNASDYAVHYVSATGNTKIQAEVYELRDNDDDDDDSGNAAEPCEQRYRMKVECAGEFWVTVHSVVTPSGNDCGVRQTEMTVGLSDGTVVAVTRLPGGDFDVSGRTSNGLAGDYDQRYVWPDGQPMFDFFDDVATVIAADGTWTSADFGRADHFVCATYQADGAKVRMTLTRPAVEFCHDSESGNPVTYDKYLVCRRDLSGYEFVDDHEPRRFRHKTPSPVTVVRTLTRNRFDDRMAGLVDKALSDHLATVKTLADRLNAALPDNEDNDDNVDDELDQLDDLNRGTAPISYPSPVWDQCNVIQDYLTVYDGSLATDPVLVRLCGGDAVPDIVSSGPNMLLEFHTSAFDNPFHPVPLSYLPGFELDVEILFVDNKSPSYAKNTSQCEFFIKPFNNTSWGLLDSPRHSLPPNTSCKYHFQGFSHQTVWLSFIKYHAASTDPNAYHLTNECNARLRIWDKVISSKTKKSEPVLMGEFCKEQDLPRLCDHALLGNDTRHVRPCAAKESYTSSADELTVEIYLKQGSVLFPLQFLLRYEFVDQSAERRQGPGDAGPAACSRTFTAGSGYFGSPKNVFFYGRGGRRNLTCAFRFTPGSPEERVRITVSRIHSASAACATETDARTDRSRCVYGGGSGADAGADGVGGSRDTGVAQARVTVTHYPWPDIELPVGCACSALREPFTFESYPGAAVRVEFAVRDMNVTHDHRDFGFSAEYAFVKASPADRDACRDARERRHLRGPGGFIDLIGVPSTGGRRPAPGACADFPWLIGPATADSSMLRTGGFVYMKLRGYEIQRWRTNSFMCPTRNRVVVYTGAGDGPKTARVICPYDTGASYNALRGSYEAFSPGWAEPLTGAQQLQPNSKTVAVEFLNREYGAYAVTWMEVSKMPRIMPSTNVYAMSSNVHPECAYRCPELNACISSQFWCDGETHCPMGFDEDPANCASRNGVNLMYVGVLGGTAVVLFTVTVVAAVVCLRCKANRSRRAEDGRRRASQKGSAAVDPMMCAVDRAHYDKRFMEQNGGGGVVGNSLGKRYPSSSDDLYLECKQDSMC